MRSTWKVSAREEGEEEELEMTAACAHRKLLAECMSPECYFVALVGIA